MLPSSKDAGSNPAGAAYKANLITRTLYLIILFYALLEVYQGYPVFVGIGLITWDYCLFIPSSIFLSGFVAGFTDKDYNLAEVIKALKKYSWISDITQVDIPYYNQYDGAFYAVEFKYKAENLEQLAHKLHKNKLFKNHYFGV